MTKNSFSGFTLVETLIGFSILVTIALAVSRLSVDVIRSRQRMNTMINFANIMAELGTIFSSADTCKTIFTDDFTYEPIQDPCLLH
ncbi:MAG: prepilin-type N-terminal cleavage/methylation domain-containing protein [Deltaproteobacteria bacterium]|nr:prepilin-type N-terminal cleavage/methylation domain-containing protein [Deltaproteobacteria bacterium]